MLNPFCVEIKFQIVTTADGILDIIPTKIIIEIPFPTPLFVICSPSHISSEVPATNPVITIVAVKKPGFINICTLWFELYEKYSPNPSIKANTKVNILVYLLIFCLPSSPPSFVNFSNAGITNPNN